MKNELKCKGSCGAVMPEKGNDGYRKGVGDEVVEWVCDKCHSEGVRLEGQRK